MFKTIAILISLVISTEAISNSSIGERQITHMIFHDSGNLFIYFSGEPTHSEECSSLSSYVLPNNNPHFNQIYSGLLAAMHSGAKVNGYVNGCVTVWSSTRPKITRIDLFPNR